MNQEVYNIWSIILQSFTALGAIIFAVWQTSINHRLKKLQDYTALNFLPLGSPTGPQIQIYNVGKQNLYLHKLEAGIASHTFDKPRLLPVGVNEKNFYAFPVQVTHVNQEFGIKLYLTDESGKKQLSTGAYVFDTLVVQQQTASNLAGSTPPATLQTVQQMAVSLRAWTYKIKAFDWEI